MVTCQSALGIVRRGLELTVVAVLLSVLAAPSRAAQGGLPKPDHVIIVIEENHAYHQILGSGSAPYLNALAAHGASFSRFFALHHPSQPNYIDLFSGSSQGVANDKCPPKLFTSASLGGELIKAGRTFRGYAEDLPRTGALEAFYPEDRPTYARKHCPWIDFADVDASLSLPLAQFPARYEDLPSVAFVIPNLLNDMHNGTEPARVRRADTWLKQHLDAYVQWSKSHNSLLIVTWDEDNHFWWNRTANQIPTLLIGPMVKPGVYSAAYNHHDLLRTIEAMYGLPLLGGSRNAKVIMEPWIVTPRAGRK